MKLPKYSMGVGDRFARQGEAQLRAMVAARDSGVRIAPVWNKSNREHKTVGTRPESVRAEADAAVRSLGWTDSYFVDADHIGRVHVDEFAQASDFFTIDVAETIGQTADDREIRLFVERYSKYAGKLEIPGLAESLTIDRTVIETIASQFLRAVHEARDVFHKIVAAKGSDDFVTEMSMDETSRPQTPVELLFILAALADQRVPVQTIAPRFSGRFNKGVDYVGDVDRFANEFEADLAILAFARDEFGLPANLKLSVHSGSDKFSIYGPIRQALRRFDAGIHVKTAGTTWLEEVTGLAAAGGDGLETAKQIYRAAHGRREELCGPYASVIDIDPAKLPPPDEVDRWDENAFVSALRHDRTCDRYNPHLRQLLHVGYKVAAEMGGRYLDMLDKHAETVGRNVTENILERHLRPLFWDD
ncbi:MAG: hypothetical protein GX621_01925 [Pirellulaceae bacterium]|nr:hypothetical protein [Pirellulaceae bacterium]